MKIKNITTAILSFFSRQKTDIKDRECEIISKIRNLNAACIPIFVEKLPDICESTLNTQSAEEVLEISFSTCLCGAICGLFKKISHDDSLCCFNLAKMAYPKYEKTLNYFWGLPTGDSVNSKSFRDRYFQLESSGHSKTDSIIIAYSEFLIVQLSHGEKDNGRIAAIDMTSTFIRDYCTKLIYDAFR